MKNITVSVDEETHRLARIRAAELGTSVSALVRGYLKTLVRKRADQTVASRQLGFMAGQIKVPDDFDSMGGPEIEKMFGETHDFIADHASTQSKTLRCLPRTTRGLPSRPHPSGLMGRPKEKWP